MARKKEVWETKRKKKLDGVLGRKWKARQKGIPSCLAVCHYFFFTMIFILAFFPL